MNREPGTMLLEVCIDTPEGLERALASGARRLEVCSRLDLGGLTPTHSLLDEALEAARPLAVPVHAMVRSRANTRYQPDRAEFAELCTDLMRVRAQGAQGAVFGLLTADGRVDRERTRELVHRARPLSVTFHRAFDQVRDPLAELEVLISLGVERVLTSGGAPTALEGLSVLRQLVRAARGRIGILPGGGVRAHNAQEIARESGALELHGSVPFQAE